MDDCAKVTTHLLSTAWTYQTNPREPESALFCLQEVLQVFGDVRIAYGESDEYSFVFRKDTTLYGVISSRIPSTLNPEPTQTARILKSIPAASMHVAHVQIICGCAGRRASKLTSLLVSLFSASYVRGWSTHFPDTPLLSTPCFDCRAVLYPTDDCLRDYLSWRQVDTHINNQVRLSASFPAGRLAQYAASHVCIDVI